MAKHRKNRAAQILQQDVAELAARIVSEEGAANFSLAKQKAAVRLDVPANCALPTDEMVAQQLRLRQRLYTMGQMHGDTEKVAYLLRKSCEIMEKLLPFNPYLTGTTLEPEAPYFAEIVIQLFVESAKEVEIFLLNQHCRFVHEAPRSARAEAVLALSDEAVPVHLVIYPVHEERVTRRKPDGSVKLRARLPAVRRKLATLGPEYAESPF